VEPAANGEPRRTLRDASGRRADATPSIRMLTARAMPRKGRDPLTVAQVTHVPQALVEFMRDIDVDPRPRRAG
jgi:hypothetical protein